MNRHILLFTLFLCAFSSLLSADSVFRVVYTNDTMGHIEACATCTGKPMGGLPKRVTSIQALRSESVPMLLVDSGNLSDKENKLGVITDVMAQLKYDAVGSGDMDNHMSDAFANALTSRDLPYLSLNTRGNEKIKQYIVKEISGVKVGIISFGSVPLKTYNEDDLAKQNLLKAYAEVCKKSDFVIVLDQTNIITEQWLKTDIKKSDAPDIVISGLAKSMYLKPRVFGRTYILPTYIEAKCLGIADVEYKNKKAPVITWHKLSLNDSVESDTAVSELVKPFNDEK